MRTTVLLRTASIIAFLFVAGHALGGLSHWSPIGPTPVLDTMRTFHFDVMGVSRSYLDFYLGFGHGLTVFMLLQAVLLWQLASAARANRALVRPMVVAITIASAASTIVTLVFLFPLPAVFGLVLTLVLAAACVAKA
jgi:hypothetical protein